MRDGCSDLAIVKTWGPDMPPGRHPDLARIPLGLDPIDVLLPVDHPMAGHQSVALSALAGQVWAVTPQDDPFRDWLSAHEAVLGLRPAGHYEAAEIATLVDYVAAGLAVAAIARLGRGPLPDSVAAVPLSDRTAFRRLELVHRHSSRGPGLRMVVDALTAQAVMRLRGA